MNISTIILLILSVSIVGIRNPDFLFTVGSGCEKYGKYILPGKAYNGSDFHYVTLDIQFYIKEGDYYKRLY